MTATNNVTEALQRTMGLMQKELERSVLSSQLLGKQTPSSCMLLTDNILQSHPLLRSSRRPNTTIASPSYLAPLVR